MVSLVIFSVVPPTEPCALRSTQPLKVSTRDFSWGKGGRCVWLTTYHPRSAETSRKSGALTYPEPLGSPRPVAGHLYFTFYMAVILQNISGYQFVLVYIRSVLMLFSVLPLTRPGGCFQNFVCIFLFLTAVFRRFQFSPLPLRNPEPTSLPLQITKSHVMTLRPPAVVMCRLSAEFR